jgi:hypothetical protein
MVPDLASGSEQVFLVTFPPRWVFALPVASRRRPIEHALDPPTHPACRLRLRRPDRLQHLHHQPHIDRLDGQGAKDRVDVGMQRARPLRRVLGVFPAGLMRFDIARGTILECHRHCRGQQFAGSLGLTRLDRIDTVKPKLSALPGLLSRLRQRDGVEGA